jgi:hypothetical protein
MGYIYKKVDAPLKHPQVYYFINSEGKIVGDVSLDLIKTFYPDEDLSPAKKAIKFRDISFPGCTVAITVSEYVDESV